jgi:hypothetical protein
MKIDGFEIQLVLELDMYDGTTACEPYMGDDPIPSDINEPAWLDNQQALRAMWTVYAHIEGQGVQALADFDNQKDAVEMFEALSALLDNTKELHTEG